MKKTKLTLLSGLILVLMLIKGANGQTGDNFSTWSDEIQAGNIYEWEIVNLEDYNYYDDTTTGLNLDQTNSTPPDESYTTEYASVITETSDGGNVYINITEGSTLSVEVLNNLDGLAIEGILGEGFEPHDFTDYFEYRVNDVSIEGDYYFLPIEIMILPVITHIEGEVSNYFELSVDNADWGIFEDGERSIVDGKFLFDLSEVEVNDTEVISVSNATGQWDVSSGVLEEITLSSTFSSAEYSNYYLIEVQFNGVESGNEALDLPFEVTPIIGAIGVILLKRKSSR